MISVIIPCYRCQATIERALNSVLSQTFQPKEILLIDDASNDGTLEMLRGLEQRYAPLVKVLELTVNAGPGVARNTGWDAANQPWLAFLDADDAWHPRKLEIQTKCITANPEVAVCGHATQVVTDNNVSFPKYEAFTAKKISYWRMLFSNQLPTRTVMLRRSLHERFSSRRLSEDYQLWLEIILSGKTAWRLDLQLAYSFRPEFSPGGLSGQLWAHEKNELGVFKELFKRKKINFVVAFMAMSWSFIKYCRRFWIMMGVVR